MPAWTLGDLMSRATARIGRRDDIAESDVSFWINTAYQEVADAEPSALMETLTVSSTTSGEFRLELPADCKELTALSWHTTEPVSSYTLARVSTDYMDSMGGGGGAPAERPSRYALYNNWLELYPSPDSSYSLQMRYIAEPSDMTATTAVPSLETSWRVAVLYLGEALLHEHLGNELEGAQARARYVGYAASLKNRHARRDNTEKKASLPLRRSRY